MTERMPLVLQLQAKALNSSSPIADLLVRAKVVATKLGLDDALNWIRQEMDGYQCAAADLPSYRVLYGRPQFFNPARGWCPIICREDNAEELYSRSPVFQPAATIEKMIHGEGSGTYRLPHPHILRESVSRDVGFQTHTSVCLAGAQLWGVVQKVRELVVDWTLDLEKSGVIGDGISFTVEEKSVASTVSHNYFAQNIGVAGNVNDQARVDVKQAATAPHVDLGALQGFLGQLHNALSLLPHDVQMALTPNLAGLDEESKKLNPDDGTIRKLLAAIRRVSEGASGNLVATGVIEGVKALVGG